LFQLFSVAKTYCFTIVKRKWFFSIILDIL
jgi:hypothetical protein